VDTEAAVEAVVGVTMKPLSSDPDGSSSDIVSERTSNEEDVLLASSSGEAAAEVDPSSSAPVEATVEAEAGTAVGGKRKTGMGEPKSLIWFARTMLVLKEIQCSVRCTCTRKTRACSNAR